MVLCGTMLSAASLFETVGEISAYAKKYPEQVPISNNDWLNPDFSKFHLSRVPSRLDRLMTTIRLKSPSEWQPAPFIDLLRRVTELRKKNGFNGDVIQRHEAAQDDHFLVWGNLQGAFHSLVATLEYLKKEEIIDNDLRIVAPKYFMVFSGNVIDRSPYSLDTLAVVLRLMEVNPTRVFYVRGNHENQEYWRNFDLRNEVEVRLGIMQGILPPYADGVAPFTEDINAFFNTLPMALYLGMKTLERSDGIRIGHFSMDDVYLNTEQQTYVLNAVDTQVIPLPVVVPKERKDEKPARLESLIHGDSNMIPDYTSEGIWLRMPDHGNTAWSVLSASTQTYQKEYDFFVDSYADVTIGLPMRNSTITQHYQDARNRTGFKVGRAYNMFSSQSQDQFKALKQLTELRVGTSIDLKRATRDLGQQIKKGLSLAVNTQNQKGTIPGHIVSLTVLSDDYETALARRNIEILAKEYNTSIILNPGESEVIDAYLDLIRKNKMIVLFPFTGVVKFRSSKYPEMVHYQPSFLEESEAATRYVLDTIDPDKIAIFYQADDFGHDTLEGAKRVFKEKGFTSFVELPYARNTLDFKDQAAKLRHENPSVIALFATSVAAKEFIFQVGVHNLTDKRFYGVSSLGSASFREFYQSKGLRFIVTSPVPNPETSELQIVQEFRKEAVKNNVPLSPQALQAYISGSMFVEGVRMIKGPVTHESILKSFESMKNYDFKGLKLSFNKATRELSSTIWLDTGEGQEWMPLIIEHREVSSHKKNANDQAGWW